MGCTSCRARKVKVLGSSTKFMPTHYLTNYLKCDEGKPCCSRCQRVDGKCTYEEKWARVFRDQNEVAKKGSEKKQNLRKLRTDMVKKTSPDGRETDTTTARIRCATFKSTRLVCQSQFAIVNPQVRTLLGEIFVNCTRMMARSVSGTDSIPCYRYSSEAVFSNNLGTYHQARSATQIVLKRERESKSDELLASLLLLIRYAISNRDRKAWPGLVKDAVRVAKSRGKSQANSEIGLCMLLAVNTQTVSPIIGIDRL